MKLPVLKTLAALLAILGTTSCMTTYDAYGNPQQTVDPVVATAGVVAAGALGYAIADNDNDHRHHHYYRRPHHRHHW